MTLEKNFIGGFSVVVFVECYAHWNFIPSKDPSYLVKCCIFSRLAVLEEALKLKK